MAYAEANRSDRLRAIAAVVLLHAVAGTALIRGFDVYLVRVAEDGPRMFNLPLDPPSPPEWKAKPPEARPAARDEGEAAPPALEARPKPIVAPEPQVRIPVTPKLAAPPIAVDGARSTSGASSTPGPGTGAGGTGEGTGSGASGAGPGGGGSGEGGAGLGPRTPARLITGRITRRDYPRSAWREGLERRVSVRFTVGPDGRASACRVTATSGEPRIDAATCRVIEATFRYEPARRGDEPVSTEMAWTQVLWTERD